MRFLWPIFLFLSHSFMAQNSMDKKQQIIEERIDFLLDVNETGDVDYTSLFEQLEIYYEHPIQLNSTNKEELIRLQLLSEIQINKLLEHIGKNGDLIAMEELQSIETFDLGSIKLIQPFVKIGSYEERKNLKLTNILKQSKSQLFLRYSRILEEQKGYSAIDPQQLKETPNARYLGNADRYYIRYKSSYSTNFSLGVTAEKDAGEEFFRGSNPKGFDFYSAHFYMNGIGRIKQLAIGDYQAHFGQGLTFASGLGFGISGSVQSLKKNAIGLRPYTSVQEDLFLRGAGICYSFNKIELTIFHSSQKVDANISDNESQDSVLLISSLPLHGFHRTANEMENKNTVRNKYWGSNLRFNQRNLNLGVTAVSNELQAKFEAEPALYKKFSQISNENINVGMDYNYLLSNMNFFGEFSKSIDGGTATTNAILFIVDPRLSIGVQHRNYQKKFRPIQSNAIGENTNNSNEKGTFIGINAHPFRHCQLSAYIDQFNFPWLKYRTDGPSEGYKHLLQLTYEPSKKLNFYFRYRNRSKGINSNVSKEGMKNIVQQINQSYRLHLSYWVSDFLLLKNRLEISSYQLGNNEKETGFLIYQDLNFQKMTSAFSLKLRFALFDTDSYNSRIYAYENDILYAFSIPAYSGRGSRFYCMLKYRIRRMDLWLRFAQSYYSDRKEIGSGKNMIAGNTKSEIKAQLRYKF